MKDIAEFISDANEWCAIFDALEIPKTADYNFNPTGAERWLVICRGGNTRSVAVAMLLKYKYNKDALTASIEKNSLSTLYMLAGWADRVLVMEDRHYEFMRVIEPRTELLDLTRVARLRSHPYDIPFLLEIDKKLKELINANAKTVTRNTYVPNAQV
jgi:hypothetical protein